MWIINDFILGKFRTVVIWRSHEIDQTNSRNRLPKALNTIALEGVRGGVWTEVMEAFEGMDGRCNLGNDDEGAATTCKDGNPVSVS